MKKAIIAGAIIVASSLNVNADSTQATGDWGFSAYLGSTAIDSETAKSQLIEDSALSLGFTADYERSDWLTTLGLELIRYSDDASFTVTTLSGFGSIDDSDSDASGVLLYAATGRLWRFGEKNDVMAYAQGGLSAMTNSERSVSYCSNCPSQDIEVDGGAFVRVGLLKNVSDSIAIGGQWVQYVSGDGLERNIAFTISSTY